MQTIIIWVSYLLFLYGSASLHGQARRGRVVTPADHKLWHTLTDENISPDGKWVSYILDYANGPDTLFLHSTKSNKRYIFPNAKTGTFSPDGKNWGAVDSDGLILVNHAKGVTRTAGILQFSFTKAGYIIMAGGEYIIFRDMASGQEYTVKGFLSYNTSPNGDNIACITRKGLSIIHLGKQIREEKIVETTVALSAIEWDSSGNALAFLEALPEDNFEGQNHRLHYYDLHRGKKAMLDRLRIVRPPADAPLFVNGGKVFFYTCPDIPKGLETSGIQIWDSENPLLYPAAKAKSNWKNNCRLTLWDTAIGNMTPVASDSLPNALLTLNSRFALRYDRHANQPHYLGDPLVNLYAVNLETGKQSLLVEKQVMHSDFISGSAKGNYITWFREGNWWVHDLQKSTTVNITTGLEMVNKDYDWAGPEESYGMAGWSSDEKYLLVYDRYGIWLLSPDGQQRIRLTDGKKNGIAYRIGLSANSAVVTHGYSLLHTVSIDLSKGLWLEMHGTDHATGYAYWDGNKVSVVNYGNSKFSGLKCTSSGNYIYKEESFEVPPKLMYAAKRSKPKMLLQSNPHALKFAWGASVLVDYTDPRGIPLQGALFYPAGYGPGKKYPMVVLIYERLSQLVNQYHNPGEDIAGAFSVTNYTQAGYVVLCPDIAYRMGEPGFSASDCVNAAVDAAIAKGVVNEKRIGLIGGSFGGYETAFIISQTDRFAAAVSGCGFTDLVSWYLSVRPNVGTSNIWRFESQQQRMGKSLYENYSGYIENSPIRHAANINTPLLSWSGVDDPMVVWEQGLELHLALKRLGKKHIYFVYPGEGHAFINPETINDRDRRIKQWFDFYLKGIPLPPDFSNLK